MLNVTETFVINHSNILSPKTEYITNSNLTKLNKIKFMTHAVLHF